MSRASAERRSRAERDPGPRREKSRSALWLPVAIRRVALGPGSRCARPGHERAQSRRAKRTVARSRIHDVKQRSVVRSRGAFVRPGSRFSFRVHRNEGWAERRQAHYVCCRAGEARPLRTSAGCGASHDAGRSPLGAPPWRFSAGAALPSPALPPDPCSELLAARSSCLAGGVPDLPSPRLRAAAAGRHSPLRLQDRLRKTPLMSEDGEPHTYRPVT